MRDLTPLLEPESVAVVGASATPGKAGYVLLDNIRTGGFTGRVYPVNPRGGEILGWQSYPKVGDIPGQVDLAVLTLPRESIVPALRECAAKGVRAAVIITAGFKETGGDGPALQAEIEEIARSTGILVIGPNTIGMVSAPPRLISTFVPFPKWHDGPVAIFAQTGLYGGGMMNEFMAQEFQHPEIRYSLTVGNKAGIDEVDFLRWAGQKDGLRAIGLHLEGVRDIDALVEAAGEVNRAMPVVVLKSGRTDAGARASRAHTGSERADAARLDAGLDRMGVTRAEDIEDLLGALKMLSWQPLPRGRRVTVVTWTGAQGVITMDQIEQNGLEAPPISDRLREEVRESFPSWAPIGNPLDIWVAVERGARAVTEQIMDRAMADPDTDMVLCVVLAIEGGTFPEVGVVFRSLVKRYPDKPLAMMIWGPDKEHWLRDLQGTHIPVYPNTRAAVRAMAAAARYADVVGRVPGRA